MSKVLTVAILGSGHRGLDTYGKIMLDKPDKFKVVACCDPKPERLDLAKRTFNLTDDDVFADTDRFFEKRRADVLLVTTLDATHVKLGIRGLSLGYDMMMEKPISDDAQECKDLLAAQKKYGGKVIICHVLRYAPAFRKVKELLDGGAVGRLICIEATEQVAFWHFAHSYVRGNWRRSEDTTPIILAKCCHDLDLLQYYAGSSCVSVSSIGDLTYFKEENAPADAAKYCYDCPHLDTCPYSCKHIYVDFRAKTKGLGWPCDVVCTKKPYTLDDLVECLKKGPYGRCVFHSDNDVPDHQITTMTFANGVQATQSMVAFTNNGGRIMYFHGTMGEVILDEQYDTITVKHFFGETEVIKISSLADDLDGHGGGDARLLDSLYEMVTSTVPAPTQLTASVESHLMGIAAEKSRLAGGKLMMVHE